MATIFGTNNKDLILDNMTQDVVYGWSEENSIGDEGPANDNDNIWGGQLDIIYAGNGDDRVTVRGGNSVYTYGGSGHDRFYIENDAVGENVVDGGDGVDFLSYHVASDSSVDCYLSLVGGAPPENFVEIQIVGIEQLEFWGGGGDDYIVGGDQHDKLQGNGGNDKLFGGNGEDWIEGGSGYDELYGEGDKDRIYAGTGTGKIWSGAQNDQVYLEQYAGSYFLDGGEGIDRLFISRVNSKVDLKIEIQETNEIVQVGDGSSFVNFEVFTFIGGQGNDIIFGGANEDSISGSSGNDVFEGKGGADYLTGGTGVDTAQYLYSLSGVQVDLNDVVVGSVRGKGGDAQFDQLSEIENLTGSMHSDTLSGDQNANVLKGMDGDDIFRGNGGNDAIDGGSGLDLAKFGAKSGDASLIYNASTGELQISTILDGIDVYCAVEQYEFSDGTKSIDSLMSTASAAGNIAVTAVSVQVDEGYYLSGKLLFEFSIDTVLQVQQEVFYEIVGVGEFPATSEDFVGQLSGKLVFEAGESNKSIQVGLSGDWIVEANETVAIRITGHSAGLNVLGGEAQATILNDDNPTSYLGTSGADWFNGSRNIDIIQAGDGDDHLEGGDHDDFLYGEAGNDELSGRRGKDYIDGGSNTGGLTGIDIVTYLSDSDPDYPQHGIVANLSGLIQLNLDPGTVRDTTNSVDVVVNVEGIVGTQRDDTIYTADLSSTGQKFVVRPHHGNNTIFGSLGIDVASYEDNGVNLDHGQGDRRIGIVANLSDFEISNGVTTVAAHSVAHVFLPLGNNFGKYDFVDTLQDIEEIVGTNIDDVMIGDAGDNTFYAQRGFDYFAAGNGSDTISFRLDVEILDGLPYRGMNGIIANLSSLDISAGRFTIKSGTSIDAYFFTDTLIDVENVEGTNYDDVIYGSDVSGTFTGLAGKDKIFGGLAADILDGGLGRDAMVGGLGDDIYHVDDKSDKVTEGKLGGVDTVILTTLLSYGIARLAEVENVTYHGTANFKLTGNAKSNILQTGSGNDLLDGLKGADTLVGKNGDDIYIIDDLGDIVDETGSTGIDLVKSAVSFSLSDILHAKGDIENLTLTGSGKNSATGNGLANIIVGNSAYNLISGGAGNDKLTGGSGNDTFVFNATALDGDFGADTISDFAAGKGIKDIVQIDDSWGFATSADVLSALHAVGKDMVLTIDADTSITFTGKATTVFHVDDFLIT